MQNRELHVERGIEIAISWATYFSPVHSHSSMVPNNNVDLYIFVNNECLCQKNEQNIETYSIDFYLMKLVCASVLTGLSRLSGSNTHKIYKWKKNI